MKPESICRWDIAIVNIHSEGSELQSLETNNANRIRNAIEMLVMSWRILHFMNEWMTNRSVCVAQVIRILNQFAPRAISTPCFDLQINKISAFSYITPSEVYYSDSLAYTFFNLFFSIYLVRLFLCVAFVEWNILFHLVEIVLLKMCEIVSIRTSSTFFIWISQMQLH